MNHTQVVLLDKLEKAGYTVWFSFLSPTTSLIIENPEGLFKVMVRTATQTDQTPILTLSALQRTPSYRDSYYGLLVVEPVGETVWLIPMSEVPMARSVRLGVRFEEYKVKPIDYIVDSATILRLQEELRLTTE